MRNHRCYTVVALLAVGLATAAEGQTGVEQEIIRLERDWCTAVLKRDPAILGVVLADDFTGLLSNGKAESKKDTLAGLTDPQVKVDVCVDADFRVRVFGDTAVVTAVGTRTGTNRGVAYKDRKHTYTDVFVRRSGRWQCVASHSTILQP